MMFLRKSRTTTPDNHDDNVEFGDFSIISNSRRLCYSNEILFQCRVYCELADRVSVVGWEVRDCLFEIKGDENPPIICNYC